MKEPEKRRSADTQSDRPQASLKNSRDKDNMNMENTTGRGTSGTSAMKNAQSTGAGRQGMMPQAKKAGGQERERSALKDTKGSSDSRGSK